MKNCPFCPRFQQQQQALDFCPEDYMHPPPTANKTETDLLIKVFIFCRGKQWAISFQSTDYHECSIYSWIHRLLHNSQMGMIAKLVLSNSLLNLRGP